MYYHYYNTFPKTWQAKNPGFLYDWTASDGMLGMLGDIGFAETLVGCSNVSSGAGVVSARADAVIEIDLKPYITEALNEAEKE